MTTITSRATGVAIATSPADAAAVAAVERHHAELSGRLSVLVEALLAAAANGRETEAEAARLRLIGFIGEDLLPHAAAEEVSLYPAASDDERAKMLVETMVGEHRVLERLCAEITNATDPVRAAAAAHSLQTLFDCHQSKENDFLLPAIAANPQTSLAAALTGMHEFLKHDEEDQAGDGCGGNCSCGESDAGTTPVLDVRSVPHSIRHSTVFGALDAVPAGGALVLVAPHDPLPLLDQIRVRTDGAFAASYEERGPEAWRLRLVRDR